MKKLPVMLIVIGCLAIGNVDAEGITSSGFTLRSPELGGQLTHAQVFSGFGCSGANISPALEWKDAPEGT